MFYYYGRKYKAAGKYPAPNHRIVVEPFGGSAAYACWHAERGNIDHAIVYDLDRTVVDLWHRLQTCDPDDLPVDVPVGTPTTDPFLIYQQCSASSSRVAARGGYKTVSPHMKVTQRPAVETVRRLQPFCRDFEIIHGTYADIPDSITQNSDLTWFVDPPYQLHNEVYQKKDNKGGGYAQGEAGIDFAHLGEWCMSLAGHVIVCECSGADWLPFEPLYQVHTMKGKWAGEVVWVKGQKK